jgi:hypothetical protein
MSNAVSKPHFTLSINFIAGAGKQEWELTSPSNAYAKGEADAKETAGKVCSIVTGQGAKLLQ